MHILSFSKFTFAQHGGIERYAEDLARGLVGRGHRVTVLVYDNTNRSPFRVDGITVVPTPYKWSFASQPLSLSAISLSRALTAADRIDVVHAHFPDPLAHLAMTLLPPEIPKVVTWHSDIVRQKWLGYMYQAVSTRFFCNLDHVIGASPFHVMSRQIPSSVLQGHRHVIPYGIDRDRLVLTEKTRSQAYCLRQKMGGELLIFALGRHVYYKGFEYLIDAVIQSSKCRLILGGEGPLFHELAERSSVARDRILMPGAISSEDLPAYFEASDVFCLPSVEQSEAFGLVQAEAMAFGKPVVNCWLNNAVNFVSVHSETGISVAPRSIDELIDAFEVLRSSPDVRMRYGLAAKQRVAKLFSLSSMIEATEKVFLKAIQDPLAI
jgi:glycosyltransferase involved in cell wall biosynthesis